MRLGALAQWCRKASRRGIRRSTYWKLLATSPSAGCDRRFVPFSPRDACNDLHGDTAYVYPDRLAYFTVNPTQRIEEYSYLTHLQVWLRENWVALPRDSCAGQRFTVHRAASDPHPVQEPQGRLAHRWHRGVLRHKRRLSNQPTARSTCFNIASITRSFIDSSSAGRIRPMLFIERMLEIADGRLLTAPAKRCLSRAHAVRGTQIAAIQGRAEPGPVLEVVAVLVRPDAV